MPLGRTFRLIRRLGVSGGPIGKGGVYEEGSRGWEGPGREWAAGPEAAKRSSRVD